MTMGPEPITRILVISFLRGILFIPFHQTLSGWPTQYSSAPRAAEPHSSLPFFHHFPEVSKEIVGVVRPGARLRMVLHTEQGHRAMTQALERVVVQVHMGQ